MSPPPPRHERGHASHEAQTLSGWRSRCQTAVKGPCVPVCSEFEFEHELRSTLRRAAGVAVRSDAREGMSPPGDDANAWRAQLVPRVVDVVPAPWAVEAFKVVCIKDGVPLSVYDGTTKYRISTTVMQRVVDDHRGGIYVYRTLEECMRAASRLFPSSSALLREPRAVVRLRAWMEDRYELPAKYDHGKEAYTYVHVLSVMPMPPSWEFAEVAGGRRASLPSRLAGARPGIVGDRAKHELWQHRHRIDRRDVSLARRQAETMRLEEEIAGMEQQLRSFKG